MKEKGGILLRNVIQCLRTCIVAILLSILLWIVLLAAGGYQACQRALQERSIADMIRQIQQQSSYTELSQIPQLYIDAVLAAEDPWFYRHNGINVIAIADALVRDLKAKEWVAGGSTITQQLCKNQFFTQKKTFTRKFAELFMVQAVERCCSKDIILELYINSIYYGSGYYTLADASTGYFDKVPASMNAWECTLLAGIPNAPSAYAPTVSPELALARQQQVLAAMERYGYLTRAEVEAIIQLCPESFGSSQSN